MTEQSQSAEPICIALATPPGAIRAGLRAMLAEVSGIRVVYEGTSLASIADLSAPPDIAILTPGAARGLDWAALFAALPGLAFLFLLPEEPARLPSADVLNGRVWGVLPLGSDEETLTAALRALYQGLLVSPPGMAGPLINLRELEPGEEEDYETLTPRETEILQQMTLGLTNKQIALALGISEHTVKYHISSVYTKLKAMNRAEAVSKGARRGLIEI